MLPKLKSALHNFLEKNFVYDHVLLQFGNTALLWASRRGYVEIVKKLLEFGADQNTIGANGVTALITAIRGRN